MPKKSSAKQIEVRPLTLQRWNDLEALFGKQGACGGCWCMWWRQTQAEYLKQKGESNKKSFKKIVESGEIPGLLAYLDGKPVGWCAFGPRESYPRLKRSRILAAVDNKPVWSVTCFFVAGPYRGFGVSLALLKALRSYAKECGARILEAYPVEPGKKRMPDAFAWTGFSSTFRKAGFKEIKRRSATRPIMRYKI